MAEPLQDFQSGFGGGAGSVTDEFRKSQAQTIPSFQFGALGMFEERYKNSMLDGIGAKMFGATREEKGKMLSPEEAKSLYDVDNTEPMRASTAEYKSLVIDRQKRFERMMQYVDTSGVSGGAANLGIGLLAGFTDPANIVMFGLAGKALSAGSSMIAARYGATAGGKAVQAAAKFFNPKTIGQSILAGGAEEALESATLEAIAEKAFSERLQTKFGAQEYFTNILEGAVLGLGFGGIKGTFGSVGHKINSKVEALVNKRVQEEVDVISNTSQGFVEANKTIDTDVANELNSVGPRSSQDLIQKFSGSRIEGSGRGEVFTARFSEQRPSLNSNVVHQELGKGIFLTPSIANNSNSNSQLQVDVSNSNIINSESPVDSEVLNSFLSELKTNDVISKADLESFRSAENYQQLYQKIFASETTSDDSQHSRSDILNSKLNEIIKADGVKLQDGGVHIFPQSEKTVISEVLGDVDPDLPKTPDTLSPENPRPRAGGVIDHVTDPVTSMDYDESFTDMEEMELIVNPDPDAGDALLSELELEEFQESELNFKDIEMEEEFLGTKFTNKSIKDAQDFKSKSIEPEKAREIVKAMSVCKKRNT